MALFECFIIALSLLYEFISSSRIREMIIPVVEMQSPCVLPSNAPALESLPVDSEDIGSDSSDNKSRTSRTNLRTVKKKKRTRSKPQAIDPYGNKIPLNLVRDPVLTNVEFQSPKYINYRSKQRNPKRTKNGQVWTGELEEAFQAGELQTLDLRVT